MSFSTEIKVHDKLIGAELVQKFSLLLCSQEPAAGPCPDRPYNVGDVEV